MTDTPGPDRELDPRYPLPRRCDCGAAAARHDSEGKDVTPAPANEGPADELRAKALMLPLADDAPGFVGFLCDRIGAGRVLSWLKDCRLEWRGDSDAALIFRSSFAADRARREHSDTIRELWGELHGGELILETRRAA